jgi:RNA polymerase sigma-70 factor (ECF subfamily)
MASRTAIDRLRRRRKEGRGVTLSLGNMPSPGPEDPGSIVSRRGQASELRQAIAELPARDAIVFSLRYLDDLSYEQIAAQMRLSVNQVGVILHRTRRRLREILDRRGVEQGE